MSPIDIDGFLFRYRYYLLFSFIGLILISSGVYFFKSGGFESTKVEILGEDTENENALTITVEINGAVIKPGVYKFKEGSRIDDILIASGGYSTDADRNWADKNINRAAKLIDGQKIYIPSVNEQSNSQSANKNLGIQTISSTFLSETSNLININTSSLSELDNLPGIGPVYGQNIIDHRPYSSKEELVKKGIIKQSTYDKIKDLISVN